MKKKTYPIEHSCVKSMTRDYRKGDIQVMGSLLHRRGRRRGNEEQTWVVNLEQQTLLPGSGFLLFRHSVAGTTDLDELLELHAGFFGSRLRWKKRKSVRYTTSTRNGRQ